MAKIDIKKDQKTSDELSYIYPEAEKITIDKASLQIQLDKFKSTIINVFSFDSFISLLVTLSAVWVPLFTSEFKPILKLSSVIIKGCYIGFATLVSLYVIYRYIIKPAYFFLFGKKDSTSDPEKMAQIILDKCSKK